MAVRAVAHGREPLAPRREVQVEGLVAVVDGENGALSGACVMKDAALATELSHLHLVPSGPDLVGAEIGESLTHCEECDKPIPDARRKAVPGVRLCIVCQEAADKANTLSSGYNRRGSKDSQLR